VEKEQLKPLSFYIHIPYCIRRCGYCDFNTYTPSELKDGEASVAKVSQGYVDAAIIEINQAFAFFDDKNQVRPIETIFFGGGTPTLLPAVDLARILDELREKFGFSENIEITTEANPDSVSAVDLKNLRTAGMNRVSFGMQSAKTHVLATLDRTHNPARVSEVVNEAIEAGFEHVSLDLIYGVPGESIDDWKESVTAALSLPIDHLSAYALIVEEGTKLGAQVRRGDVVMPPDDESADKYLLVDELATKAGMDWYEVSNWSLTGGEARHNIAYWHSNDWWGIGAGAHSHVQGVRWWNVKHPTTYISKLISGESPMLENETLTKEQMRFEEILLRIRLSSGLPLDFFTEAELAILNSYLALGHLDEKVWQSGQLKLSISGRLIADQIVRALDD
jgi:putative oxygen-independent coproporphyrinogen III oxidase